VAACLVGLSSSELSPRVRAESPPEWAADAVAYVRDPRHNRQILRRFARHPPDTVPVLVQLLLADARFRAGHARAAGDLASRVLETFPDARGSMAYLLCAMSAFSAGDLPRLEALRVSPLAVTPTVRDAATLFWALRASDVDPGASALALEALGAQPRGEPAIQVAIRQATGLAWLWAGDPRRALAAFEAVAARPDAGELADDAAHGAALARWRLGETSEALSRLAELALAGDRSTGGTSRSLALLERGATLRAAARRLRRVAQPFAPPSAHVTASLDAEAAGLARRALEVLEAAELADPGEGEAPHATPLPAPGAEAPFLVETARDVPTTASEPLPGEHKTSETTASGAGRGGRARMAGLALALVLAAAGLALARRGPRRAPPCPSANGPRVTRAARGIPPSPGR